MKLASLLGHTCELLQRVRSTDKPADSIIDSFFRSHKYLGSHDRRFIAETTYGTLRHLRKCEHRLLQSLEGHAEDILPTDGFALLIATYLIVIDRKTKVLPEDLSPNLKSHVLNGKLGPLLKTMAKLAGTGDDDGAEPTGLRFSFPDWMVAKFVAQYGQEEADALCRSLNEQAPITLRVNEIKTSLEDCQRALKAEGIETRKASLSPLGLYVPKRLNVFQLQTFREGMFEVQDEGSQLLTLLLDPKPTARVLDLCAGAGGKTLGFAALMKNRGEIVATDVHTSRLEELRKRARRAGVSNVRVRQIDDAADLEITYPAHFDLVLVDAPCSGIGTMRRNPGMKWTVTEEAVKELSEKQSKILNASASLVAAGGRLAYATCTLFREENEEVVEQFLRGHPEFALSAVPPKSTKFDASKYFHGGYVRFLPHREGTDGFFIAVLQKRGVG